MKKSNGFFVSFLGALVAVIAFMVLSYFFGSNDDYSHPRTMEIEDVTMMVKSDGYKIAIITNLDTIYTQSIPGFPIKLVVVDTSSGWTYFGTLNGYLLSSAWESLE